MSIVTYNNRSIANISAIPGAAKSLTHIKTLTASGDSTLSFVDGSSDVVLDSTYPIYLFKCISIHPSANGGNPSFQASTNAGSSYGVTMTTTAFEAYHDEADSTTALAYSTSQDLAQSTSFQKLTAGVGNDNDQSASGTLMLFNPSSTTFVKHFISDFHEAYHADYATHSLYAGYFNTTSAIDAIQFKMHSGDMDAGTIKLYGLKDS
jgi:hypothetical protein